MQVKSSSDDSNVLEVIISLVKYIIFQNESFYILELEDGMKAKGTILDNMSGDITGLRYEFTGHWTKDRYGKIFVIEQAAMQTHELYFFLSKIVKGLGEKLATILIDEFGDELEDIIENKPDELTKVKGIKAKKKEAIVTQWHKYSHLRKISKFLGQYGISANLIAKVYAEFGEHSVEIIESNPYSLMVVHGVGFRKADEVALKQGVEFDSPVRLTACASYIVEREAYDNGHTYIILEQLISMVMEELELEGDFKESIIDQLQMMPDLVINDDKISLRLMKQYEEYIYDFLINGSKYETGYFEANAINQYISDYEKENNIFLSENQIKAVHESLKKKVFALTGYAGTGKSTISKIFMNLLNRLFEGEIIGCAMSGIAARRLSSLTGFPAFTIHSLLKYDGKSFEYGSMKHLPHKVIIIDEAGMVNVHLFYSLISALDDDAIFIMVGDDAQLPPIGAGNVFSDMISGNLVSYVKLDKVFRQSEESVINIFANVIRTGEVPEQFQNSFDDWRFRSINIDNYWRIRRDEGDARARQVREDNNQAILDRIIRIAEAYYEKGFENILTDLQILAPQKKGLLGIENLNIELQKVFNPLVHISESEIVEKNNKFFAVGDKVVHLKNTDMNVFPVECVTGFKFDMDYARKERVFNGTLGVIVHVDNDFEKVYVHTVTDIIVEYDISEVGEIIGHAYALTVHKAQGSEFKSVILPLTMSNFMMLDNQWLYTAVTRAKKGIFIVGEDAAFEKACRNMSKRNRNTWMKLMSSDNY